MLAPIQKPTYRFPANKIPDLSMLPVYDGPFIIEEPCLIVADIPWQSASQHNKALITAPAPEMGERLSHKALGGRLTIFVLCYGDYLPMQQRCLDSILRTIPLERLDLRIAANCVGQATLNYIRTLPATKLYTYTDNPGKYKIMRDMLWDEHLPITTNYFAWFDDNCHVQHNNWVNMLAQDIAIQPAHVAMYGLKMYYSFDFDKEDPRAWLEGQDWHKGFPLRTNRGNPAPNGDCTHFCADWFFVMRTDAMRKSQIPSLGLEQKGGDMVIGEQLYQNGYALKSFNVGKSLVFQPPYKDLPRRNTSVRKLPWQPVAV